MSTMIPSEEEKNKLQELQLTNPDVPLGAAEQFLSVLCSIPELSERLQLWAFKMDYDTVESVSLSLSAHHITLHCTLCLLHCITLSA